MAALFFDIDGTLITEGSMRLLEGTKKALQDAKKAGHRIFINTGRTRSALPEDVLEIGFDGLLCGCGTFIALNDGILLESHIEGERGLEILSALKDVNGGFILEGTQDCYFEKEKSRFEGIEFTRKYFAGLGLGQNATAEDAPPFDKVFLYTDKDSRTETFFRVVAPYMQVIDRGGGMYEIIQKGYTKGTALTRIAKHFGYTKDALFAFGDSSNDLDMFQCAGHGVAMGNSSTDLLRHAEYVTDTVENGGIEKALRSLNLIQEEKTCRK